MWLCLLVPLAYCSAAPHAGLRARRSTRGRSRAAKHLDGGASVDGFRHQHGRELIAQRRLDRRFQPRAPRSKSASTASSRGGASGPLRCAASTRLRSAASSPRRSSRRRDAAKSGLRAPRPRAAPQRDRVQPRFARRRAADSVPYGRRTAPRRPHRAPRRAPAHPLQPQAVGPMLAQTRDRAVAAPDLLGLIALPSARNSRSRRLARSSAALLLRPRLPQQVVGRRLGVLRGLEGLLAARNCSRIRSSSASASPASLGASAVASSAANPACSLRNRSTSCATPRSAVRPAHDVLRAWLTAARHGARGHPAHARTVRRDGPLALRRQLWAHHGQLVSSRSPSACACTSAFIALRSAAGGGEAGFLVRPLYGVQRLQASRRAAR